MSDDNQQPDADQQLQPSLQISAQYVKDLSFENPNAPRSLTQQTTPPPSCAS
jgi:preprotein translocase subunit SecB